MTTDIGRRRWPRTMLAWLALAALLTPLAISWLPHAADAASSARPDFASLRMSLAVALAAAFLAVALGVFLATTIATARLPARAMWITLLLAPFASPGTVWTLAQTACYGRGGFLERWLGDGLRPWLAGVDSSQAIAATLVLAQVHSPLVLLILLRGYGRLQFAGAEAAKLYFSGWRQAGWYLRALRKELLAAGMISFALSLANFAVPHVLQCRLYIVEVYMLSANYLDQLGALVAALPLAAVAVATAMIFSLVDRHAALASASGAAEPAGRGSVASLVLLLIYIALTILLPVAALAWQCRSPVDFVSVVQEAIPETLNTLLIAGMAAGVAAMAAGIVAPWCVRRNLLTPELLAMSPLGLPPLVIGLAYARTFHRPWPEALALLTDTSLLAALGLACRGLPFATRILAEATRRQAPEWHEAAALAALPWWRRWGWIDAPLWLQPAATAAIVVFVLSAGDVEVSHLLTAPGGGTLAMRLFTFLHFGPAHVTAGLAMWQLIVALTPVFVYFLLTDRWLRIL